jgi:hypothetical protein
MRSCNPVGNVSEHSWWRDPVDPDQDNEPLDPEEEWLAEQEAQRQDYERFAQRREHERLAAERDAQFMSGSKRRTRAKQPLSKTPMAKRCTSVKRRKSPKGCVPQEGVLGSIVVLERTDCHYQQDHQD